MKRSVMFLFAVAALAFSCEAQYTAPGSGTEVSSVKYILDNAAKLDRSEAFVKIEGTIFGKINGEDYWFKDDTGEIKVEIDYEDLPSESFDENTKMRILGEVDHELFSGSKIDAKVVEIIKEQTE